MKLFLGRSQWLGYLVKDWWCMGSKEVTGRQSRRREKKREDLDTEGWMMSNWTRAIWV
jgi:hypothetical protein